ncbi:MAG: hypothetical protein RIM72_00610 [Alphaproteobacteria bacterium]
MIFQWPTQTPEPQGHSRRTRRRRSAENKAMGGYLNLDGTYNESFQKAIANDSLPQPVNPFGRPVLPKREANAPRYEKLGKQLRDNALVRKRIPKGEDDSLANIVGTDEQGSDILVPRSFAPVWDDDMETLLGHMDWQKGIAVPLGHAFPGSDEMVAAQDMAAEDPARAGVQIAQAIPFPPPPLPPPAVPGQPPNEGEQFPQGPGTIPMEQAQQIEKWILEQIPEWEDILPPYGSGGSEAQDEPTGTFVDRPDDPVSDTIQESRDARKGGKKATDSGKNDPHGDGGRALEKARKREEELKQAIENAPRKRERNKLKQKRKRINRSAEKKNKGETHGRK